MVEHSSSSTPRVTSQRWLNCSICRIFNTEPPHPAFGFIEPITTRGIRACTIAPATHLARFKCNINRTVFQPPVADNAAGFFVLR